MNNGQHWTDFINTDFTHSFEWLFHSKTNVQNSHPKKRLGEVSMAGNYLEKFDILHQALAYHSLDLGYKYGATASGGTIYIVLPSSEVGDKIDCKCALTGWPKSLRRRKGFTGALMESPLVFHLWNKQDLKKVERLRRVVETIVANEFYAEEKSGDHPYPDEDELLD